MNTVKKTWPFEIYDFNMINKYVNDMANKGYALEKVGSLFATYEKTAMGAYKYSVDYVNKYDMESEEYEEYKKKWIDAGWEFVDQYDGLIFFRCARDSGCRTLHINQRMIRDAIDLRVKRYEKHSWLQAALKMIMAIASAIAFNEYRIFWIVLAMMQFVALFPFVRYLKFRKSTNDDNFGNYHTLISGKYIGVLNLIKWIEKIINMLLIIALCYVIVFVNKSYFFTKLLIVIAVIVIGITIHDRVKESNEKRINKLDFESGKGKLLVISIGMLVTIGVMLSFVMIDQTKPQEDIIRNSPCMILESREEIYYIEHDYGNWNYQYSSGIETGLEEEFLLPLLSEVDKVEIDNISNKSIGISFLEAPDEMEVRYWEKENFEDIKTYDKGYKTVEIQDGAFEPVDGEVVYVVYAKWEREFYGGFGYYVFCE